MNFVLIDEKYEIGNVCNLSDDFIDYWQQPMLFDGTSILILLQINDTMLGLAHSFSHNYINSNMVMLKTET